MSEIRENKITGESVIIAPERAKRGGNLVSVGEQIQTATFLASCPFCPGNEALTVEERFRLAGESDGWGTALPAWRFHRSEHMVAELSQRAMTS